MRPLKLTLQAFGSYPDKIEIPFENLGSSNLFLISGVTGSGKTTIFDAICFALFNTSSGSNKGNANFRSHFADEKTLSFVEFEFLFNGEKYTVTRSPSYERKKLRNEGYIQESSKAQLMLPNSKLIIGVKEVDEYIIDLLGINASQFSQIALLAQGEFIKLLNCSTQERGEIFRNIFQTNDFQAFQLKLKDRMLEFKTDYENIKSSILQYINQVETNDEKINSLKENYKEKNIFDDLNIFIELLEKETKIQDKKIKENNHILEEINKKELELKNKLEKIKIKNDLIKTQKNIEINLENQLKEYVEIKKEFENLDKKNNELQNLSFQIKKLEEDYQKIKELETLIDKESKIKKEVNLIQEEITLKQIKSAKILSMELDNLKQELNNNQEYFKNKDINVKNLSITYEKNYHEYLSSQAGILALSLKEDMPCPVCGSLKHPNKAKTSLDIVSQEDLNNLKETLENEKNILNDLSKNCSILIENINTKERNYLNFVKENNIKNDDIKEIKTDKTFEELLEEILNKKNILSKLNDELIEQNTKLELIKKDLKNKNIDDIDKNYQESIKKQENLIKEINSTKENHENKTIAIEQNNSKLELIKTQLIEYKNIETKEDNLSNKIEENIIKKEQIEKINKELLIKTTLNKKILENIKKQYQIFEKTSQDYTQYKILSDCANGNLKGSKRIAFEQYIQAYYLDMVILEANKRLKIMSKNQYQLQRKKEAQNYQSKTGLDIEVMDFHTFKTRSTKTLSGGESFIAALALALGLSDCISKMSGMINLDAIFIDEGFGSLDSDSLELAMDVISNLSETNKLIGIISHVQDLKNRIQNQIISIKTNSGSKIKLTF